MISAPNNDHHKPEGDGSILCAFMKPNFPGNEDVNRNPQDLKGTAEGVARRSFDPTFRQQDPLRYENRAGSTFNIEGIFPMWLQNYIKRLFPEARNPG